MFLFFCCCPVCCCFLAVLVPLRHDADAVDGVVLVWRERARDAVRVEVLVSLQGGRWRLDPSPGAALAAQCLVSHGALVHGGVVTVSQLRRGVAPDPAQSGHQRPRGEVSGEVLVGQPLHGLHGATPVGRDARPGVAADVLQTGNGLGALRGAGVHARLPLAGFVAVRPAGEPQALGVADGAVVMVVLAGRAVHVGLLVAVLAGVTVVLHCRRQQSGTLILIFFSQIKSHFFSLK